MILDEFRNEFDILYNNIASNAAPPIDDYEKSVFLTQAQDNIVKNLYRGDPQSGLSFENSEESREYLSDIVVELEFEPKDSGPIYDFDKPSDLLYILRETCIVNTNKCNLGEIEVKPTTLNDLNRSLNNPFKRPSGNKVIRANIGNTIRLYSKYPIEKYKIVYLQQPRPIVLSDLEEGLSINGVDYMSECELNPAIHRDILNNAVALAKATYIQ
jgi:hypothetical protein